MQTETTHLLELLKAEGITDPNELLGCTDLVQAIVLTFLMTGATDRHVLVILRVLQKLMAGSEMRELQIQRLMKAPPQGHA